MSTGHDFEAVLASAMRVRGFTFGVQVDAGMGLWKSKRADFLVNNHPEYPGGVFVEARYQDTAGTADEKIPYLVLSMRRYPRPAILVFSGQKLERAAEWARGEMGESLVAVMTTDEFLSWLFRSEPE